MNLFELSAKLSLDDSQFNTGIKNATTSGQNLTQNLKTGLTVGFNALKTGITVAVGALATFGAGMVALAETTREYRADLATLDVAFRSVGNTVENGTALYQEFYGLLGETDQAVEAANQLATIARNQEDVAKWTDISAGIMSTFQDSMPLETLTESVAQTSELGKITGVLADAVNRAGMSEDTFNAQLAELTTQQERAAYITDFLNDSYAEAGNMYQELNQGAIDARKAQENLNAVMGTFGGIVEPLVTTGKTMLAEFLTPFTGVAQEAVDSLVSGFESGGVDGLIGAGSKLLGDFLLGIVNQLPTIATTAINILVTLTQALIDNAPQIALAAGQLLTSLAEGIFTMLPMLAELAINLIINFANYLAENAGELIAGAIVMITTLAQLIIENLPIIIETVVQIILAIIEALATNAPLLIDAAFLLMTGLVQGLWQSLPIILAAIGQIIVALLNLIVSYIAAFISAGVELITGLWNGAKQVWANVTSWISSAVQDLLSAFSDVVSSFFDIGKNIVTGIWNGIKSGWEWLTSSIADLANGLLDAAKGALGIASPSKEFAKIGAWSAEGMGVGFDEKFKDVKRSIENSLDFSGAVTPITADTTGATSQRAVTVIQNIYTQAKTAADLLQETIYQQERAVLLGAT